MFFLRRKPKDARAEFDEFLSGWEKLQDFDPRERRDPTGRLRDFLQTFAASVEAGRTELAEAGRQSTTSSVNYLLDTLCRLPVPPATSARALDDPQSSWEKLESDVGIIAGVVNRFRLRELQAVSLPGREKVDRLRDRAKEMGRWADRGAPESAHVFKELEDAVTELNHALEDYDRSHPEYRDYLRQLAALYELYRAGSDALADVTLPEGFAVIVEALKSPEPERGQLALDVLLRRGWQPGTLEEELDWYCAQAKRPELRSKAVSELAGLVSRTTDPATLVEIIEPRFASEGLTDLQDEGLPDLRAGLIQHLAALGGDRAAERLAAVMESHTESPGLKVTVIRLLARANTPRAVELLVNAMSNLETEVRLAATEALADVRVEVSDPMHEAVLERLVFALRDGEPVVRDAAVQSLRKHPDAVEPLVRTLLEDRNPAARESAARTFCSGLSPDPVSTAGLTRALADEDAAVRYAAAEALAAQGCIPTEPEEKILYLCAKQDWRGARQAGPSAMPHLLSLLKDRDENVRLGVVKLLGSLRARDAAADVGHLLSDTSQEVRQQVAVALAAIGDEQQVGALRAALAKEGFEEVRREIENAVRRLEKT
ncbi:MAG: HEAT repeat domain-containing protein [candidate division WOR-3 bacterium]|nr:HEAT repeat domain-containing protein [candidate division WOR-3 bacterium]